MLGNLIMITSNTPRSVQGCHKPECLIITPTRELAIQIKDESRKFAMSSGVKSVVTYGGASIQYQLAELVRGCNILIATPGRYLRTFLSI